MEDLGKKLYEMWTAALWAQNISADEWDDLEESDRIAWRNAASEYAEFIRS